MYDFESDKTTSLRKSYSRILTFGVCATDDIEDFQFFRFFLSYCGITCAATDVVDSAATTAAVAASSVASSCSARFCFLTFCLFQCL